MDVFRRFASEAPALRSFREDKPTLLVCWWCTLYAVTIIIFRISGRYVRAEKLFLDDKIMLVAVIPLLTRMAFVHVALVFGTNNTLAAEFTDAELHNRAIGSGMVLLARIFDATYLWAIKYSTLMFLRSLTAQVATGMHTRMLQGIQILLGITFLAVVIITIGECHPFTHYWRVVPDPGPSCRQAPAQFVTLAAAHAFTNLALVVFPIPMILKSRIPTKRKFTTSLLLSLPLLNIIFTAATSSIIPATLFVQHTRSLFSSLDALLNAFIANAVVLCALLQDKGYKKSKYKQPLTITKTITKTRPRGHELWDSEEELIMGQSLAKSSRGASKVAVGGGAESEAAIELVSMAKLKSIRVKQTWEVEVEEACGPARVRE